MNNFKLKSNFKPTGDQPQAIASLTAGLKKGLKHQTLLGVTGSGKTFSIANIIEKVQKPTLIISHNKTLTAQLASEFQEFFPDNEVHYFVSYYDYYQPESYLPRTDTYIEKETQINEEIERLRHAATQSLLSRKDVIIVASVSCIYGLGNPQDYQDISLTITIKEKYKRQKFLRQLINMLYKRNDTELTRGTFTVKGEILEIYPPSSLENFYRLKFFGDNLEKIEIINHITKEVVGTTSEIDIFPASHYFAPPEKIETVVSQIEADAKTRINFLKKHQKILEASRLEQRIKFDMEMIQTVGYVTGIENYSRYFDGRKKGEPPFTLLDYFQFASTLRQAQGDSRAFKNKKGVMVSLPNHDKLSDWLIFIDESHMTIPQIRGMFAGDQSRKQTLVEYGFRLPSALDNRPLNFSEFENKIPQIIYISATPGPYEKENSQQTAEQIIRPTGLLDPEIEIRPVKNQIPDLIAEITKRTKQKQRVLVTALTKKISEELTDYLLDKNIKAQYLHSEIDTLERLEILRDLRQGKYDVVVGINLLREGLDLPEVSLVAILDADKEGFLRSETALIQTMGRAARHLEGRVIMYADNITGSMQRAMDETKRRRKIQTKYNKDNKITPQGIKKQIKETYLKGISKKEELPKINFNKIPKEERTRFISELTQQMEVAAQNLEFEKAAKLRDQIHELNKK